MTFGLLVPFLLLDEILRRLRLRCTARKVARILGTSPEAATRAVESNEVAFWSRVRAAQCLSMSNGWAPEEVYRLLLECGDDKVRALRTMFGEGST